MCTLIALSLSSKDDDEDEHSLFWQAGGDALLPSFFSLFLFLNFLIALTDTYSTCCTTPAETTLLSV